MLEANISDIDIELDDNQSDKSSDLYDDHALKSNNQLISHYIQKNFVEDCFDVPEVPFVHWSIYR